MKSINRILLLTDFSEISDNAMEYAVIVAKKTRAEIQVMHIVNTPVDWVNLGVEKEKQYPETRERIADARVALNDVVSRFRDKGIIARSVLIYNLDVESIPEYVKDEDLDLIIMGSHGVRGIKEFTIGSNAQKVLRASIKPVLIVKNKPKYDSIKEVLFASTFDKKYSRHFESVLTFVNAFEARVHLLYINTPYDFKETHEMDVLFDSYYSSCAEGSCTKHIYNAHNEESGVKYFLKQQEPDVFAIVTEGRSAFSQIFSPSLTEKIVNHLDVPVLSINVHEK
ncbi:universal stress protein [Antarcticibacterium flavum]|uniref:Universal stress protein n=1 Tax=Antarcticibacterium flavum TaxID=2058175 RepID=A0A5B7WZH1_9FLAO|nr:MULTISPECIES: universal stress protein [Antarcticibacterium]MCM4158615.1 universal stress protein [Antarcticibacterium sp. W02-3]QCY68470.1 universal stress protein [Antarcticibacterium flavum]